jgi:ribosomal protein L11 methyltransferase
MQSLSDPRDPRLKFESLENIRRHVLNRIGGRRCIPADLIRGLMRDLNLSRGPVQVGLQELVAEGEIAYVCEHGQTFLEPSFDRPVRVSDRVVLTPPERAFPSGTPDALIRIMPGAAFGAGRHPTTRLALKAIDFTLGSADGSQAGARRRMLDIGTGSGVLAMAAVMLGIETGLAIDIDPCAVAEARANIELNGLSRRIAVSDQAAEAIDGSFDLVIANLRTPTLARLAPCLGGWTAAPGALVMSGIRTEECSELLCRFGRLFFDPVWRDEEQEWVGLVLTRKG